MTTAHQESLEHRAFIAVGSNLHDPLQQLDNAIKALREHQSITPVAMSKIYLSKPHGVVNQADFFNAVVEVKTTLSPDALLDVLHNIEAQQGRVRKTVRWGPRTLDLDIILYDDIVMTTPTLTIPHPRAHEREFVMQPLSDLDNTLEVPNYGKVAELIKALPLKNLTEIRHGITYHH
ncbi:MAG: 2-amino-4-hydroxy-6-hydroxymethyldihydropteridine diphosphokinase [Gammaproteobacteria bacterium]|nr:MAG: 2-amino-4-hydroxy-6-hydroxymethyldihydropteridine diphosphokinase [Gammaproteobacteria bacterium]